MKRLDRRYLLLVTGLGLVAALPLAAGFTTVGWELAEICGLAGTVACLALCGCPIRPREGIPPVLLSLARHQQLGWMALAAASLHGVVAIAADPTVIQYLKPTSPLYQLAGLAALAALVLLVVTAMAGMRRRLWRSHRGFQAAHILLGCALLVLLGAHVATTGRYAGGYARRILLVAVMAGAVALLLRGRRAAGPTADVGVARRSAFGRHSRLVTAALGVTMLGVGALIPGRGMVALREPVLPRNQPLPLNFDHRLHTSVNCLVCHHNYADGRGFDACITCHKSTRPDLKVGVEARFHGFCLECHRSLRLLPTRHGPVSGCVICHQAPTG